MPKTENPTTRDRPSRTILLVEDDQDVADSIAEILQANRLEVVRARDGQEAIEILEEDPARFHLLLSDIMMPRVDGWGLADRFLQLRPGHPVILITGFAVRLARRKPSLTVKRVMHKPLSPQQLLDTVERALADMD